MHTVGIYRATRLKGRLEPTLHWRGIVSQLVRRVGLAAWIWGVLLVSVPACGGDGPSGAADTPPPTGPHGATSPSDQNAAGDAARSSRPPVFEGVSEARVVGWGRVLLEWTAAIDDATPTHEIRYEVVARRVGFEPSEAPDQAGPVVEMTAPGVVEAVMVAPADYTGWSVRAVDGQGNRSAPSEERYLLPRPRLRQIGTGAVDGSLTGCRRVVHDTGILTVCGGERGRIALWNGQSWRESTLESPGRVGFAEIPDAPLELVTFHDRYRITTDAHGAEPVERSFRGQPRRPFRRFGVEPSGLRLWLDADGLVWASDGGPFRPLDDPLLQGPDSGCTRLVDFAFTAAKGFARCWDGRQFTLLADDRGYRWTALDRPAGLELADQPAAQVLLGDGLQVSMLDRQGRVWRYDLGGWRVLAGDEAPISALVADGDGRTVLAARGGQIVRLNALGEAEPVADVDVRYPLVYFDIDDAVDQAISAQGEVVTISTGDMLRSLPPQGYGLAVGRRGELSGVLAGRPRFGLYARSAEGWSHQPLAPVGEGVELEAVAAENGTLVAAADAGPEGGQILRIEGEDIAVEPILYPPPPSEEPPPDPAESGEIDAGVPEEIDPASLAVGVPADELPEPPPPPPPVRALDIDPESGTAVAAGDGGTLWLRIEGGWLQLTAPDPTPLLAVAVIGDHHYLVGGVGGVLLDCLWTQCEPVHAQPDRAPGVGDIRAFRWAGDDLWALGADGLARREADGRWVAPSFHPAPPYPAGHAPQTFVALTGQPSKEWLLSGDGSVWRRVGDELRVMAHVPGASDLWAVDEGTVLIVSDEWIYELEAPGGE